MQTYSHGLIGVAAAASLPLPVEQRLALVIGSVICDAILIPTVVIDRRRGLDCWSDPRAFTVPLNNIAHSLLVWVALIATTMPCPLIWWFAVGGLSHVGIDTVTHGDRRFPNPGYLWPFAKAIRLGTWDYRIGQNILRPKTPELILDITCVLWIIVALW